MVVIQLPGSPTGPYGRDRIWVRIEACAECGGPHDVVEAKLTHAEAPGKNRYVIGCPDRHVRMTVTLDAGGPA